MARADQRGTGQVLREGAARAPATHADVPALERARQLPVRTEEEETETRQKRRSRYVGYNAPCRVTRLGKFERVWSCLLGTLNISVFVVSGR